MNLRWRQYLPLQWNAVLATQDNLRSRLAALPRRTAEELVMSVSELVENAVKYGVPTPSGDGVLIELDLEDESVEVRVTNRVRSEATVPIVEEHLERLKSERPEALYADRMKQLFAGKPSDGSRLGLYRIAWEGRFRISFTYRDRFLTVVARRTLGEA